MSDGIARCTVYDRQGALIDELSPAVESVVWRMCGMGRAGFSLAWSDSKCTAENLALGNRVLFEFDNGLPDWGGIIDPPRNIDGQSRTVTVSVYTGEKLLDWRVTDFGRYFDGQYPGYIVSALITEENLEYPTGISIGSAVSAGEVRTLEYHHHDLLVRLDDMVRLTGQEYQIVPVVDYTTKALSFSLSWVERLGSDKQASCWLLDGANVEEATQDLQGPLASRVLLVGHGTDWSVDRIRSEVSYDDVRDTYGYREYAEVQSTVESQATLDANAAAIGASMSRPKVMTTIKVANREPALFEDYAIGDVVRAMLFQTSSEWAYDAPVRVVGREWLPSGSCRLEVQEWQE